MSESNENPRNGAQRCIGLGGLDAVEHVLGTIGGEVHLHPLALGDVLKEPGVGRAQLGAIVELHQVERAIHESHPADLHAGVFGAGPVGHRVSNPRDHAERQQCNQDLTSVHSTLLHRTELVLLTERTEAA